MTNLYIVSKRFFLQRKELFYEAVASITKKEFGSTVDFLQRFTKS